MPRGNSILLRPSNTASPNSSMLYGRLMVSKLVQSLNASCPIDFTPSGIIISFKEEHPRNVPCSIA